MTDPSGFFEANSLRTYALTVAYDGTRYAGWQIQPNGLAIQQVLSDAVSKVVGHTVQVQGSGRTDAGVHAIGQVASFTTPAWKLHAHRLIQAINVNLPRDIAVIESRRVVSDFDPIRHAVGKRYRYSIRTSRVPDPIWYTHHWWIPKILDVEAMCEGSQRLLGTHDFNAFQSLGSNRKTTTRTVRTLELVEREAMAGREIVLEIEADGFLYNMVRNIVGALAEIGKGRLTPAWLSDTLASRRRTTISPTAPARGLCLIRVDYPPNSFIDSDDADPSNHH